VRDEFGSLLGVFQPGWLPDDFGDEMRLLPQALSDGARRGLRLSLRRRRF